MSADTGSDASAWAQTIAEANEMAEDLREDGWTVVVVRAGHVAPVVSDDRDDDRFGLAYVAPDGVAESLPAAIEGASLDQSAVFTQQVGSDLYLLTRVSDPDARVAVLLVGAVDLSQPGVDDLASLASDRGHLYSIVELLDGTHLATVRHDHPADFLPEGR